MEAGPKTMPVEIEETPRRGRRLTNEILGLVLLFLAVVFLLALASFDPRDPSFSTWSTSGGTGQVNNWIGPAGAHLASVFIDLLGLSSFWMVILLSLFSWRFFRGRAFERSWLVWLGTALLLVSSAACFSLLFPRLSLFWERTPGGGLVGEFLSRALLESFNGVGAGLVVGAALLVGLLMATGLSVIRGAAALIRAWTGAQSRVNQAKKKRREKEERSKRLVEALEKRKEKIPPEIKEKKPKAKPRPRQEQLDFGPTEGEYRLPSLDLLDEPEKNQGGMSKESLMANARLVEKKLADFNVQGEVSAVSSGPVITMYEYQPAPGIKISKVAGLADDLAMNMRAVSIRIVAPLPGKAAIGIEIPNPKREIVYLKEVVSSPAFQESESLLSLVMGVDIMGQPEVANLQKMPHLLIAGATGAGKSVGLNAIIMSILFKARPDEVRFMMIDPKRIELSPYQDLPHLIYPVISDPVEANQALKWAVADMEHRYQLLAEKGVRNIEAYNRRIRKEQALTPPPQPAVDENGELLPPPETPQPLPYLVIVIDELADLMMISAKEVETSITRLAQMARAAGIHLILATQRPSVDVLTGVIKANLPTRVSFQVSSKVDSRTILDTGGAEKLLGMGDMLFMPPGTGKIQRIHGAYVSEAEIKQVADFIKAQSAPDYLDELVLPETRRRKRRGRRGIRRKIRRSRGSGDQIGQGLHFAHPAAFAHRVQPGGADHRNHGKGRRGRPGRRRPAAAGAGAGIISPEDRFAISRFQAPAWERHVFEALPQHR